MNNRTTLQVILINDQVINICNICTSKTWAKFLFGFIILHRLLNHRIMKRSSMFAFFAQLTILQNEYFFTWGNGVVAWLSLSFLILVLLQGPTGFKHIIYRNTFFAKPGYIPK